MAIQLLRTLTPTRVVALDLGDEKRAFAREMGAHEALESKPESADWIRELTGRRDADVVFDFVGIDATGDRALKSVGVGRAVVLVGAGDAP